MGETYSEQMEKRYANLDHQNKEAFNIGEKVWFVFKNKIEYGKISSLDKNNNLYSVCLAVRHEGGSHVGGLQEKDLFKTKDDLRREVRNDRQ